MGGHKAHELLHTGYRNRKRIVDEDVPLERPRGTGEHRRERLCRERAASSRAPRSSSTKYSTTCSVNGLEHLVNVSASFCFEKCDRGPTVRVGEQVIEQCTLDQAIQAVEKQRDRWRVEEAGMTDETGLQQIVFTLTARCRDCYRCLRACPVKAIRMKNGQAYVDEKRCIACGTCIRECPQQAKSFRQDIEIVQRLVESDRFVAASVAPSFAAVFDGWQRKRLPAALRALGFGYVGQTSQGAYQVSAHTARLLEENDSKTYVATACPAVVNYVEKYRHDLVGNLLPLASPMATHARMLKKRLHGKESAVVFIGPCVAKKSEILRPAVAGAVDCVLTFKELTALARKEGHRPFHLRRERLRRKAGP